MGQVGNARNTAQSRASLFVFEAACDSCLAAARLQAANCAASLWKHGVAGPGGLTMFGRVVVVVLPNGPRFDLPGSEGGPGGTASRCASCHTRAGATAKVHCSPS